MMFGLDFIGARHARSSKGKRLSRVMGVVLPACFLVLTGTVASEESLVPVRFAPLWIPQAQFAGFYMAAEKGFYRERGIDVTVLRGGPDTSSGSLLAQGEATFATMFLSQALEQRDKGVSVVNIAQLSQRSALMILARKESGIVTPKDLAGKSISIWRDFRAQPLALFEMTGVEPRVLPQSATLNLFLRGGVDAASAMWYNEYHSVIDSGIDEDELDVMFYRDYGLNFPEDGIYCLRTTLADDASLCCRFVQASLQGWDYAFEHSEETLDVVMRHAAAANTGTNRAHQRWMLARMKDLFLPADGSGRLGGLNPEDFALAAGELKRCGIIRTVPQLEEFHAACIEKN